jgi:hypothetical protein
MKKLMLALFRTNEKDKLVTIAAPETPFTPSKIHNS